MKPMHECMGCDVELKRWGEAEKKIVGIVGKILDIFDIIPTPFLVKCLY